MNPYRPFESLAQRAGFEPEDAHRLVRMGALVGLLFCAYTIAKVLRDALFLGEFGALKLPYAYVAVALASMAVVWVDGRSARRMSRHGALRVHQYTSIALSIAAAVAYPLAPRWTTALFYVWTGSQAMMLMPHFWGMALDVWDSRTARRTFPVLAGCGLLGGQVGGAIANASASFGQRYGLLWMLPVFLVLAHLLTRRAEGFRAYRPQQREHQQSPWAIMRRSRYVVILAAALALGVIVGTLVDFQFKYLIQHRYPDPNDLTHFLGRFYLGLNALSLVFQFGLAAFLLQRLGIGMSTALQPVAVLGFAIWAMAVPSLWVVSIMRWIQGVLSQTLGKSSSEIYYSAIRPNLRRRIKPAMDTLVERWSDALVGVLLAVVLHALHVPVPMIAVLTAVLTALWIATLVALDRQYGRVFQQVLSSRWIEPGDAPESMRVVAARRTLLEAIAAQDERRIVLALGLSGQAKDVRIVRAVRQCVGDPSPAVRVAAVRAMETMGIPDRENRIAGFLDDPNEALRAAAVHYLVVRGPRTAEFAHRILAGDDRMLQRHLIDVLFERPGLARAAMEPAWIEKKLASDDPEDLVLAARALGTQPAPAAALGLRRLLQHPDAEVRRAALQSVVRRPSAGLLDVILPLLLLPGLHYEARTAVAAIGEQAIPALEQLMDGRAGERAQSLAANTLAQLGGPRAAQALLAWAAGKDTRLRHLGLRGLARMHVRRGEPSVTQAQAHRFFLREVRSYRECLEPSLALESHAAPEVRLLAESFRECAELALERAVQALACWYDPEPLIGVLDRLRSRDLKVTSPALEFLEHTLPRSIFAVVRRVFEEPVRESDDEDAEDPLRRAIAAAWASDDPWIRACAVRISGVAPDLGSLLGKDDPDPRVRAEIAALLDGGRDAGRGHPDGAWDAEPASRTGTGRDAC